MSACQGKTESGKPCGIPARPSGFCMKHDPDLEDERIVWLRKGGKNNSNQARARKAMPDDLKSVLDRLYAALTGLEDGTIEPARATAMANVSRAIVAVWSTADAERRIEEIERMLSERDAA